MNYGNIESKSVIESEINLSHRLQNSIATKDSDYKKEKKRRKPKPLESNRGLFTLEGLDLVGDT